MPTTTSRLSAFFVPALAATLFACSTPASSSNEVSPVGEPTQATEAAATTTVGSPGSHVGVHGMVLFGSERVYLSHIPLFQSPHNLQVIVEAKIAAGVTAEQQAVFATRGYTVRPSAFSLYDLAHGTLRNVAGTIYLGNFESGGTPAFRNVQFEITRVIFAQSMVPATPASLSLDYIAVGTPTQPYLVHVIDAQRSFDSVVAARLGADSWLDAAKLEAGAAVRIAGGVNTVAARLGADDVVDAVEIAGSPTDAASITVTGERSCLLGPDFFNPCPAAL